MNPEERAARNAAWRKQWEMAERWEGADGQSAAACARELKEFLLSQGKPRPPGRPSGH